MTLHAGANERSAGREGNCNPYEASVLAEPTLDADHQSASPSYWRWRIYLLFHLGTVVLMAALMQLVNALRGADGLRPEAMRELGNAVAAFGLLLLLHNGYASPILVILLFLMAWYRDTRYAIAGLVELLLALATFFILMPLVQ